jgi:arsenate reductase
MKPVVPVTSAKGSFIRVVDCHPDMSTSVYFNPECSTCRTAQALLAERGVDAEYVRYLDHAPSRADLEDVLAKLGTDDPRDIVRAKEPVYAELGLDGADRDQLLDAMTAHPVLIQRPIVVHGDRAVVARPAERALELFDNPDGGRPTA